MKKYSAKIKLKIVKEYLTGELRRWIKEYRLKCPSAFQKGKRRIKVKHIRKL